MSEPKYIDILVVNGAWQLDAGGQPRTTQDRHSIGQDIKHRIMESGLASKLSMPDLSMPNQQNINAPLASYRQGGQSSIPSGGLGQQLIQANAAATTANQKPAQALHIGEVHMHNQNPMTPEQMAENAWLETK